MAVEGQEQQRLTSIVPEMFQKQIAIDAVLLTGPGQKRKKSAGVDFVLLKRVGFTATLPFSPRALMSMGIDKDKKGNALFLQQRAHV